jgi:predicted small lipoprotein YifL
LLPALAILGLALALGGCGVKGNLESPQAAAAPEAAVSEPSGATQQKIFTEQSQVKRGGAPQIMPSMPPKEWSESRDLAKTKSSGSEPRAKSSAPDKPFVLDWLL